MEATLAMPVKPAAPSATTKQLTVAFTICFFSTLFSGITSMLMSVYLPVVAKDLLGNVSDNEFHNVEAYINSIFIFGGMFGGFTWGFICDRIGRAKSVVLSTACFALFTTLTAFPSSWGMVSICRFLSGFGVGGVILTTNVLVTELWPEKKKAIAVGIVSMAMPVGFIFSGMLNNFLSNWHQAFLIGVVPLALAIVAIFILPESSWRAEKKADAELSSKLFAPAYKSNLLTGSLIFGAMLIGLWAVFSWAPTWIQSITTADKAQEQRGITMMILATSGVAGSFVSGWIANGIGLRKTMMMCFAACFIMVFVVFKLNTAVTSTTFIEMAVMAFFFGISQGALSVYIPLLFPAIVRASATGFCFNIGRLFTGAVVFFIGALATFLGGYGNAVFIFSFIFLIGLLITFFSKPDSKKAF